MNKKKTAQGMSKQSSKNSEIVESTCDVCSYHGYGVIYYSQNQDPFLFECLLCNSSRFEEEHEKDKRRRSSQASIKHTSDI